MTRLLTSETHPIRIDWLPGMEPGAVGLTFAPGKRRASLYVDGVWARSLDADLDRIVDHHRVTLHVCLVEPFELEAMQIPDLLTRSAARGLEVRHFPIVDGDVPGSVPGYRAEAFAQLVRDVLETAQRGGRVMIHCAGGLGRAGTLAGCVLALAGTPTAQIIPTLHATRGPNCPERPGQVAFIEAFARAL